MITTLAALLLYLQLAGDAAKPRPMGIVPNSASNYWYFDTNDGVEIAKTEGNDILWHRRGRPEVWFRTPAREIADPESRIAGYGQAVKAWSKTLVLLADPVLAARKSAEVAEQRTRVRAMLGRDFASFDEFSAWWRENANYLEWSQSEKKLVVNADAKLSGRIIHDWDPEREVSAVEYWQQQAFGMIRMSEVGPEYVRGRMSDGIHESWRIRVRRSDADDRRNREAGYRQAVAMMMNDLTRGPEATMNFEFVQARLKQVTALDFATREAALLWWQANQNRIHLSPDGTRLVVQ